MNKRHTEENIETETKKLKKEENELKWRHVKRDNLNISFATIFDKCESRKILSDLENELEYLTGDLAKVKVFGKIYPIPRKQAAYGELGVKYKYSGTTISAKLWTPTLQFLVDKVHQITGHKYNFALVNRYKDGSDKMGFHKDDEKELCRSTPIASLTFGAERDFIFRHQDKKSRGVSDEKMILTDGLLLLMNEPTNTYWYHGIPIRKQCKELRINITFRKIVNQK